jgi:hypothetical protein
VQTKTEGRISVQLSGYFLRCPAPAIRPTFTTLAGESGQEEISFLRCKGRIGLGATVSDAQ